MLFLDASAPTEIICFLNMYLSTRMQAQQNKDLDFSVVFSEW
jgi:hypothetical protein